MGAPEVVHQLRNFDVPLMVILSGISFAQFSSKRLSSYQKYLFSRFLRLVVPTWLFLVFYNIIIYWFNHKVPGLKDIVRQVTLTGGTDVGVWIIRLFFSMSILAPFLLRLNNSIGDGKKFYFAVAVLYLLYELSVQVASTTLDHKVYAFIKLFVFFTVGYGFIFFFGLRSVTWDGKVFQRHMVVLGSIFVFFLLLNFFQLHAFVDTDTYKFPARIYYVSYALLASMMFLYLLKFSNAFNFVKSNRFVRFIGRSTLWIYLWHYFFIKVYHKLHLKNSIVLEYIVIFSVSAAFVYLQTRFVFFLNQRLNGGVRDGNLMVKIFTG